MTYDCKQIINAYHDFLNEKNFPCTGAKTAVAKGQAVVLVAGNMACPADDHRILEFLYAFIDRYQLTDDNFHSAAIIFTSPENISESVFEHLLWERLQALSDLDARHYAYNKTVSSDPQSPDFSFSLKGEAFFILGLHPDNNRQARRFGYPTLVFNPHAQFEKLKQTHKYENMKQSIRRRDIALSGSINPMLTDHGMAPATIQYSGKVYDTPLICPLKIKHATR